ncbi:hypothetical protein [Gorillibacterium sp. CAU 1737]|uniref:hypothetical protein n=1 Tax=Gorillibacterium sp. CAU 1737 TaxID=3140362 RepID=UPI0032611741
MEAIQAVDLIPRYNEDFFNCYMGHLVSYLKLLDIPVELTFYKCLEPMQRIYHSFVIHGRDRWHFPSPFFDLNLLGLRAFTEQHASLEQAKPSILKRLREKKAVFFSGDGYYVPHRIETYQQRYQPHNFLLTGYRETEGGAEWFVQDHARPDYAGWYEESIVRDCYNRADYPFAHYIAYYELDRDTLVKLSQEELVRQVETYLDMYVDDFSLYDQMAEQGIEAAKGLKDREGHSADRGVPSEEGAATASVPLSAMETMIVLERCLFFLASSRELFERFLVEAKLEEDVAPLLDQIKKTAFGARAQLMRGRTGRLNEERWTSLLKELKGHEEELLARLRLKYLRMGNLAN